MAAHGRIPTVDIVHPDGAEKGKLTINESDFDPAVHTRWTEPKPASDAKPKKRASEAE